MKKTTIFTFTIATIFLLSPQANSSNAIVNVQARNSYKEFERCMGNHKNDITQCIQPFKETVTLYKEAIKLDSNNIELQNTVLELVNSMNDIAETFYTAASNNENRKPFDSYNYYLKSIICYEQLVILYPSKTEFVELINKAKFQAKYVEVQGYAYDVPSKKDQTEILSALSKLKKSFDDFILLYGENKLLNDKVDAILADVESNIFLEFNKTIEKLNNKDIKSLLALVECEANIVNIDKRNEFHKHYIAMEDQAVRTIVSYIDSLKALSASSDAESIKGNYSEANNILSEVLTQSEYYPDSSTLSLNPQSQILKTIDNFDISSFKNEILKKKEPIENAAQFVNLLNKGESWFKDKNWLNAYKLLIEATDIANKSSDIYFSKEKLTVMLKGIREKIDISIKNYLDDFKNYLDDFKTAMNNADTEFKKNNFAEAEKLYSSILSNSQSFPDFNTLSPEISNQIRNEIKDFNIDQFRGIAENRMISAKETQIFLNLVKKGEEYLAEKEWLKAYHALNEASEYLKNNTVADNGDYLAKLIDKVQKKISELEEDDIATEELAEFRYKPISYNQWLESAKSGKFSTNYVRLSGNCQQMVDDIIILKNSSFKFDFSGDVFIGTDFNSAGLAFPQKRFFTVESYISCIGKFQEIQKFTTKLGEVQIPIFNVIWVKK